jgi:hypothetical protein
MLDGVASRAFPRADRPAGGVVLLLKLLRIPWIINDIRLTANPEKLPQSFPREI